MWRLGFVSHAFADFQGSEQFSDITIRCDDGTAYHAHKVVLASRSEYFKAMLAADSWVEASSKEVCLR